MEGIREHIFRCEKRVERLRYPLQLEKPYITLISFYGGLALFPFSVHVIPKGKAATNGNPIRQDRSPTTTKALRHHLLWFFSSSTVEIQSVSPFDCVHGSYAQLCYTICYPRAKEAVTREVMFSYWCFCCASSFLIHNNHFVFDPGGREAAWLLGPQFRVPLRAWMFVSCVCYVLCRWRPLRRADRSFRGVLLGMWIYLCEI